MADSRVPNAQNARSSRNAVSRAIVVTGNEESRHYWATAFERGLPMHSDNAGTVISERGRKGNLLGALQAYERACRNEFSPDGVLRFDQLVMLVGSGTRLSPITQSLGNMKAALILPSNDGGRSSLTVGEAAIRSSAPWVQTLRGGGFTGVVVRWGDEIIIPSAKLAARPGEYAGVDAVRFGYRAAPSELLATQKEWLVCDHNGMVHAELPRQPLERLKERIATLGSDRSVVLVNLGSFAASYHLLEALAHAFDDLLGADDTAANWDPYLWIALHSDSEGQWEQECRAGAEGRPNDFSSLLSRIPDFWSRANHARHELETRLGRPLRVKLLDFVDPYWFDAGNHASLRAGLSDVFKSGRDGDTVRALLGLPAGLAAGESLVAGSSVTPKAKVRNSVIIGSQINGSDSRIDGGIVINSRTGDLTVGAGGVVAECECTTLVVDGPGGFAFRLQGAAHVRPNEIAVEVGLPSRSFRLSYFDASRVIDEVSYVSRLWENPVSFSEAAALARSLDPFGTAPWWLESDGPSEPTPY